MKIAVLSDIHGNIYALNAVLKQVERDGADMSVHAGALVGYGPHPNEGVSCIQRLGIEGGRGNYDKGVGLKLDSCGCATKTESEAIFKKMVFGWTSDASTESTKQFLAALLFEKNFVFGSFKIGVWHATPTEDNTYWFSSRSKGFFMKMAKKALCDVIIFGHTHA